MLGKLKSFVHDGKTYNITDGETDVRKLMEEIDEFIKKCRFDD